MLSTVLKAFGIQDPDQVIPFGSGLINHTWKVCAGDSEYILQRVNHHVFREPQNIAYNIRRIGDFLEREHPGYLFTLPVPTLSGDDLYYNEQEGYFRLFPFVKGSYTIDVVGTPGQAYTAAREFGKFTRLLEKFPAGELRITIPDFHNLALRYKKFRQSLSDGNPERIAGSTEAIRLALASEHIVKQYEEICASNQFRTRVIHHDTKISNVLLDKDGNGLCVIDLDTVMPGYFISDVGDMMRTYLCPVSEEEADMSKIGIRDDFFSAIVEGYSEQMNDTLTGTERRYFLYAGQFMIYMQALRFLTDHLYNDVYYGAKYPGHNLTRANNQLVLLRELSAREYLARG